MTTFLPFKDFRQSVRCLDNKRLGKQRVECLQILSCLRNRRVIAPEDPDLPYHTRPFPNPRYRNHPAVRMWKGYEAALLLYGLECCSEWVRRSYSDTCMWKMMMIYGGDDFIGPVTNVVWPPWLGREDVHLSHQSRLIQKDAGFYRPLFPDAPDNLSYVWPA